MRIVYPPAQEVYKKVDQAITQLVKKDYFLFQIDANERTISHRLGLYLQALFGEWHVDCEYNRNLDSPKRLKTYEKFFDKDQRVWSVSETDPVTVFPDIIIHKRKTRENLLVIEMKKTTSKINDEFDYFKLREFKYQYGYQHALFLKFVTSYKGFRVQTKDYLPEQERYVHG